MIVPIKVTDIASPPWNAPGNHLEAMQQIIGDAAALEHRAHEYDHRHSYDNRV
jgi:hypothetical protein